MIETLILSICIGVSVGLSAGYLGSLMVLEKMALVGDALSHVALPGLALGILLNFNPFLGAFAFLFVSAVIIWHLGRVTKLSFETIVGAMFTLALAIGILIIPEPELLEALFGDITKVTIIETGVAVLVSAVAMLLANRIYKRLVLSMISEELAVSKGIPVSKINLLYLLLVSLVVAVGIKIVGNPSRRLPSDRSGSRSKKPELRPLQIRRSQRRLWSGKRLCGNSELQLSKPADWTVGRNFRSHNFRDIRVGQVAIKIGHSNANRILLSIKRYESSCMLLHKWTRSFASLITRSK